MQDNPHTEGARRADWSPDFEFVQEAAAKLRKIRSDLRKMQAAFDSYRRQGHADRHFLNHPQIKEAENRRNDLAAEFLATYADPLATYALGHGIEAVGLHQLVAGEPLRDWGASVEIELRALEVDALRRERGDVTSIAASGDLAMSAGVNDVKAWTIPVYPSELAKALGVDKRTLIYDQTIRHSKPHDKATKYRFDLDALESINPAAAQKYDPEKQ
ncbi:MAG: hypothetical protein AAF593_00375 [Planctomycetota bacterium]